MRKILLILTIVLMSVGAFAQYQAGNILATATLTFSVAQSETSSGNVTVEHPKYTSFEIAPGIEYFATDKIAIGGEIGFAMDKELDKDPGGGLDETIDKTSMATISPFASFYLVNEEKFAFFLKLGFGFGFGTKVYEAKANGVTVSVDSKLSAFEIGLKPGIAVHLSERFGMTATFGNLGYRTYKEKRDNNGNTTTEKSSEYGLKITPELGFGIYFKLK
jgi:hypothetical protein